MTNRIKALIALPLIVIVLFALAGNFVHFDEELSDSARTILSFAPSDITIKKTHAYKLKNDFKSPMNFTGKTDANMAPAPNGAKVPLTDTAQNELSLIVIEGKNRLAIINGQVVKEGNIIDGTKIARIESGRVLLQNKTTQWLYMEKTK